MARPLPLADFRARRRLLLKSDFALSSGREKPPTDKIERELWNHIFSLPDDVAIRTTNHHGTAIKRISDLTSEWLDHCDAEDEILGAMMLDAYDDYDAALYTAITGYYRLSVSAIRSALELVAIGTWAVVCEKQVEFQGWQDGRIELSLGKACDGLLGATSALRGKIVQHGNDTLFDQKTKTGDAGWVRRAFGSISDFTHSRPGYTDFAIRKSNGPIYVRDAFNHNMSLQNEILALIFVLLLIARPATRFDKSVIELFQDESRVKSGVTRTAFQILHC